MTKIVLISGNWANGWSGELPHNQCVMASTGPIRLAGRAMIIGQIIGGGKLECAL
jgi:hypothetical protein